MCCWIILPSFCLCDDAQVQVHTFAFSSCDLSSMYRVLQALHPVACLQASSDHDNLARHLLGLHPPNIVDIYELENVPDSLQHLDNTTLEHDAPLDPVNRKPTSRRSRTWQFTFPAHASQPLIQCTQLFLTQPRELKSDGRDSLTSTSQHSWPSCTVLPLRRGLTGSK